MRFILPATLLAAILATSAPALALPSSEGRIVRGSYLASGKITTGSVTIQYLQSRVSVNTNGRVRGRVTRQLISRGVVVQQSVVTLTGKCRKLTLRAKKGTFSAPAVLHIDGSAFRGDFTGLSDRNQRPSRYFRGKIAGVNNSNLLLRSR